MCCDPCCPGHGGAGDRWRFLPGEVWGEGGTSTLVRGGLSGSRKVGLGAHKPPSALSHAPHFSSLPHHPSPRLRTEALDFFSFFHVYPCSCQILVYFLK